MNESKKVRLDIHLYFVLVLSILSVGCTSKIHVNVFTANLSKDDLSKIENQFNLSQVHYSTTTALFPDSITENTIIYTPSIDSNKSVYQVIELLDIAGINVSNFSLLRVENHSFTANNIGLYILSDGIKRAFNKESTIELNEYGSVDCGNNLRLNSDFSFTVIFDIWNPKEGDYSEITVAGTWYTAVSGEVVLNSQDWKKELRFARRTSIESREDGDLKTVALEPLAQSDDADFYLKELGSQPNVNCSYAIYIIN